MRVTGENKFIYFKTALLFFVIAFPVISCYNEDNRLNADISKIDIEPVEIKRYEQKLFNIDPDSLAEGLKKIQPDFRIFLNGDLDDSLNLVPVANYVNDTLLRNVYDYCQIVFPDLTGLEKEFTQAFKYRKYYYPSLRIPEVYSYVSGFDYEYPVQYPDNSLLIALDMYLGRDYYRYKTLGLPAYMLKKFDRHYIVRDCMRELAKHEIDYKKIGSGLLDMIINEGKICWYTQAMIPDISDTILLDYSARQLDWAQKAEGTVWAFLLENEMLYSKEMLPVQKFIYPNPFTSYFGIDSPPRLGWFIGWRIVGLYMKNNPDVELRQLMVDYDSQKILNLSGYKPKIQ